MVVTEKPTLQILSLEDSLKDFEIIKELLEDSGFNFTIEHAKNESEFISYLNKIRFDIILSDFNIPGYDGFSALKKSIEVCPETPFIVISGSIGEETAIELIKAGAVDYVFKDKPTKLPLAINRALEEVYEKQSRKNAVEALRKTENFLKTVLSNAPITIFTIDSNGIFTLSEGKGLDRVGLKPGENVGVSAHELYATMPYIDSNGEKITGKDIIKRVLEGETINAFNVLRDVHFDNYIGPLKDKSGNIVGIVGVATDITERKRTEELLMASEIRHRRLFESAKDGIIILDSETGKIIDVNPFLIEMLGYSREQLVEKSIWEIGLLKDITPNYDTFLELQQKEYVRYDELPLETNDGRHISVEFVSNVYLVDKKKIIQCNIRDITERKLAENALLESMKRYKNLTNISPVGIFHTDEKGITTFVNPEWSKISGLSFEDALGFGWLNAVHPDDKERLHQGWQEATQLHKTSFSDYRFVRPDGTIAWVMGQAIPEINEENKLVGYIGTITDITKRKQAEDKLKESESKLREAQEMAHLGYWNWDVKTGEVEWSDEVFKIFCLNPDEFTPQIDSILALSPWPEENQRDKELINRAMESHKPGWYEQKFLRPDQNIGHYYSTFQGNYDKKGELISIVGTVLDITERKIAEEKLQLAHDRFHRFVDSNIVGIVIALADGNIIEANDYYLNMLGYSRQEFEAGLVNWRSITPPEWLPADEYAIKELHEKGTCTPYEKEYIHRKGHRIVVLIADTMLPGTEVQIAGFILDITKRKRTEEALKENNARLELAMQAANMAWWEIDLPTGNVVFEKRKAEMLGYPQEKFKHYTDFVALLHPEDKETAMDAMRQHLSGIMDKYEVEYRILTQSGAYKWFLDIGSFVKKDSKEKPLKVTGLVLDISSRKLAEEALAQEQYLVHTLLENIPEHIYFKDVDSRFIRISKSMSLLFGLDSPAQAIGKTDFDFFTKEHAQQAFDDEQAIIESGATFKKEEKETWAGRPDTWVSTTKLPLHDKTGNIIGTFGISMDITDRKHAEEALHKYAERLKALHSIDQIILRFLESPELTIQKVLRQINDLLKCCYTSVNIFDFEKKEVRIFAVNDKDEKNTESLSNLNEAVFSNMKFIRQGKMEIVEDISKITSPENINKTLNLEEVQSFIVVPLLSSLQLYGVLNIAWENPKTFNQEELEVISEVASQMTIAVEQSSLFAKTKHYATELEDMVHQRTFELELANKELEAFAHSVSHDLRAPLRHISGFIRQFLDNRVSPLSDEEMGYLNTITNSAAEMGNLIDALLSFSRINRTEIQKQLFSTKDLVHNVFQFFNEELKQRDIELKIEMLPDTYGDYSLMRQVWINLISNAIKYTSKKERAVISIGSYTEYQSTIFFIKDNGAGFNMKYADKLFGVFQRLHKARDFEGIGIGLANINRIVLRHGGRCWAEGEIDNGATFYFSLPLVPFQY